MNSKNSTTFAIPFITFHQNQGFKLSPQAQQFLNSLPQNRQLGIVSIVGKYRTGKSFFVNRVLLDQKKGGFQVGPTINPCTKGLWLWKKTIRSQSNENMDLIFIDTEGFGGMDENANHDSRIFLFSLLLSSYFIYNSVGSIDENAINTLNLIINLAKDIQTKTNNSNQDQSQFPSFLWVVRDFTLKLVDKNQSPISSKQYLQNALEFQKGTSDAIENKNKIRRLLKHFFQDRDCQIMVRPTEAQKDLQRLDQIDNSLLRPEFVNQVKSIRSKVYSSVRPKKINGQTLNGNLLVSLCKGYMETINKGHLPNVQSAWFYVCRSEGLKAVSYATKTLQYEIQNLLQNPLKTQKIEQERERIRKKVLLQFKRKAMNSEQGHPDLFQKLERRIEEYFLQFNKKNVDKWNAIYKEAAEQKLEKLREKIYCDQYSDFNQFIRDYEQIKGEYDSLTKEGDSVEKWRFFNQLSQSLYRLAGQTITQKLNNNLIMEKQLLEQKLTIQEEQIREEKKGLQEQKHKLKEKVMELQRQNSKLKVIQESANLRTTQYKNQYDNIYEKYRNLQSEHEGTLLELQKMKRQQRVKSQSQNQNIKSQLYSIKVTMEKQRALLDMQKQYLQEQIGRYKERYNNLQGENRKIRSQNTKLSSDLQDLQLRFEEKSQQVDLLQETNNNYSKKIEKLLVQNSKKSQLVGDHNEWLLQKSYLQNQVAFLKNTMNENKKLHDALLVAFQKSVVCNEDENNEELLQANKNLNMVMEKMQQKYRVLDEKYNRLKDIKRVLKYCNSMECSSCSKNIQTPMFSQHIEQCTTQNQQNVSERVKTLSNNQSSKEQIHITVSQNVVKQSQDRKKPYTQYIIQIIKGENTKWKVSKRYKQFTELQQVLINKFPYIKYPQSCNFLSDINTLVNNRKNMMAQQRRKSLQQYLRDLCKIEEIRESQIFKQFLQMKEYGKQSLVNNVSMKKSSTMSRKDLNMMMMESNSKKRHMIN